MSKLMVTDTFTTDDGRTVTISRGTAHENTGFYQTGFSGHGYVVHVDGVQVAQVGYRYAALGVARDEGADVDAAKTA